MGSRTDAVPLPFGWLLVTKEYLQSVYNRGLEAGVSDASDVIKTGKALADDLDSVLKMNERLKEDAIRAAKLIDQTQKDAYDLGYSHGEKQIDKER
ncbi:MAG: hypothetical protein DRI46_11415 [Chloroflexi bacterium]|nr:MAG: hypothetical protein DRI46_11415 [Chloroflexota bacterium]